MTTICIIPARGGSKRIPQKNLKPLCGKPLLAYTVEAARDAEVFQEIVVSSDDAGILALARDLGVTADRRPDLLAGDHAKAVDVIAELLSRPWRADAFTEVAMLLPTCPFRTSADVRAAATLFGEHPKAEFLIGVTEYDFPPQLAWFPMPEPVPDCPSPYMRMAQPVVYGTTTRSQSIQKAYRPNGSIYLANKTAFQERGTFFVNPCLTYLMPAERSLDIDHPYQMAIAEALMAQQQMAQEQMAQQQMARRT